ncbi:pyridoxamine 5'-phosphate oxidase family protein [Tianweitania sediminis]|uniref:Pyridoxamine 5'-phosphate oxidase family protein n=1 Tax=Tianweitania sediminis TaxID=1502156 RepID=A0A8J7R6K0_9HYPH|nr:pyridoxamine 5'-phosphate oxidase family protein [Tianweitania sediminis]MBP0440920.1 pyridoxamine 5'-phosphate oxidase family protein [Tianweitania sediminis]
MKINETFRAELDGAVLCWLATVDGDGMPNVTPKEIFTVHDEETLVVADIMSSNSVRNIGGQPRACLSFVDVFRQRGFKAAGSARIIAQDDPNFERFAAGLIDLAGPDYPVRNVIALRIEKISRIWAPSYQLFPERSEGERMAEAFRRYRVRPNAE